MYTHLLVITLISKHSVINTCNQKTKSKQLEMNHLKSTIQNLLSICFNSLPEYKSDGWKLDTITSS